jgi:mRNA interferase HicA
MNGLKIIYPQKFNEKFGVTPRIAERWLYEERQSGSHMKLIHPKKKGFIIFPNHGSAEVGTGLEKKIRKQAGL